MYVLLTDDSKYHPKPDLSNAEKALEYLQNGPVGDGHRVFGPFATYEEGKLAAMMLAMDADYWVIPVEPVGTVEPSPE